MKPEELTHQENPEYLYMLMKPCPILRATSFYDDPNEYIWKLKVKKQTAKGWRGVRVGSNWSSYERVFLHENFMFFETRVAALNAIMDIAKNRREELSGLGRKVTDLIGRVGEAIDHE
jgi:hypothetical protein